jgi:peptidyl-dipeptidase Dcp
VAYDNAGALMRLVSLVFGGLRGAETTSRLQEIARETTPMLSAHSNEIRMNQELFGRIQTVYEKRESLGLDNEQMRLVEKIYRDFERGGAALPEEKREVLKQLNERMSMVSLQLSENLLAENNGFKLILEDEADLIGLPPDVISSAADEARKANMEGKWVFTLSKPSWTPFLQFSERRDLREKIYRAYFMRGDNDNEHDNKALFAELMQLRQQATRLMGYNNYADFFLEEQMAQKPENVYNFLYQVWEPALARAKRERDDMQAIIIREGGDFKLESWDWWYYAEKIRAERYNLDEDEVKPYFTLDNVRRGNFLLANKLFGLTFIERPEVPVYHPEVEAFEVLDRDSSHLGILYIDPASASR